MSRPSPLSFVLSSAILTAVAGAGGVFMGRHIVAAAGLTTPAVPGTPGATPAAETAAVRELAPVVANLSAPEGALIRLQTAIVYDKSDPGQIDVTAAKIESDMLAFVKTLTVLDLQGASGLAHLREDLNERAALRSDGRVREVMIETLVVE